MSIQQNIEERSSAHWDVQVTTGPAQAFHFRDLPNPPTPGAPFRPTVWVHNVQVPTLVLGSTQNEDHVLQGDPRSAGIDVSRRRSGGGLVYIEPASSCWIDVVIPRSHSQWDDDIGKAFDWIGQVWASALTSLGVPDCEVHQGELLHRANGRLLCFAGVGPGEVLCQGAKIVGLSQRRTRFGARFQGLVVSNWNAEVFQRFVRPDAIPSGLTLDQVNVGHPSITPQLLSEVPGTLLNELDQASIAKS